MFLHFLSNHQAAWRRIVSLLLPSILCSIFFISALFLMVVHCPLSDDGCILFVIIWHYLCFCLTFGRFFSKGNYWYSHLSWHFSIPYVTRPVVKFNVIFRSLAIKINEVFGNYAFEFNDCITWPFMSWVWATSVISTGWASLLTACTLLFCVILSSFVGGGFVIVCLPVLPIDSCIASSFFQIHFG